jgi:hypothetical protein
MFQNVNITQVSVNRQKVEDTVVQLHSGALLSCREKILAFATTWVSLKDNTSSERRKTWKQEGYGIKYRMISLACGPLKRFKYVEINNKIFTRLRVSGVGRRGKNWEAVGQRLQSNRYIG